MRETIVAPALTRRRRRVLVAVLALACALAAVFLGRHSGSPTARAATATAAPGFATTFQSELGLPAGSISLFGATNAATGEAWGTAATSDVPATDATGNTITGSAALIERTANGGWQLVQRPANAGPAMTRTTAESGRVTPDGGVVEQTQTDLIVRNPGGPPRASAPPGGALNQNESFVPQNPSVGAQTVPLAAIDGSGGATGAFFAPPSEVAPYGVLHYDGASDSWTREPIAGLPGDDTSFTPEALACGPTASAPTVDSPDNCFLLAKAIAADGTPNLLLFSRVAASNATGAAWVPEAVGDRLLNTGAPADPATTLDAAIQGSQMLTVTSQGVWVDFVATSGQTKTSVSELVTRGAISGSGSATPSIAAASPLGTWCYPATALPSCQHSLGAPLTTTDANVSGYRSVAWPGSSSADPGTRVITGLAHGSLLELGGSGDFTYAVGPGGAGLGTSAGGAAFATPSQGWLASTSASAGAPQIVDATSSPVPDQLRSDPVPFGGPLLAVTPAPGSMPGDPSAAALAVGVNGQVGRFRPGAGWQPEPLLNGAGVAQHPTLRGVAWPEAGRAYAVGDNGAMWVWQASTGLWEPDPAKPFNFVGNLTDVAFSATNPGLGYAVGKQGTLLQFGKTWQQVPLGPDLQNVNFTSIAFAGGQAIATYRQAGGVNAQQGAETGGVAILDGGIWKADAAANAKLAQLPHPGDSVLSKVAGLPDGGVVAAGPGIVLERPSSADSWQLTPEPLPEARNVSAVAAYRENGALRAVVSIETNQLLAPNILKGLSPTGGISPAYGGDITTPVGPGQPPVFLGPDPLPDTGFLVRQTAAGWTPMQRSLTLTPPQGGVGLIESGALPDPVFGLLVSPDGSQGLAVGGQTGNDGGATGLAGLQPNEETAGIERFGPSAAAASAGAGTVPVTTDPSQASFVVAGDAVCISACADQANVGLAPDVSLSHALAEANQISGARGFLYTGGRLAPGVATGLSTDPLSREFNRLGQLLGGGGTLPVHAATSADVRGSDQTVSAFDTAIGPFGPGGGDNGNGGLPYYSFPSSGSGGTVTVIVLDYSSGALGDTQEGWMIRQLQAAKAAGQPAIVMGNASLTPSLPHPGAGAPQPATDGSRVANDLVTYGASAYLFDYPQNNVATTIRTQSGSIPAFGTGTLGYVQAPAAIQTDSLGSSAFLVVSVQTAKRDPSTNIAPVTAQAIPNVSQLAVDALDGTLLRRSQVGLFQGLARRPLEGTEVSGNASGPPTFIGPAPYDPIPNDCVGANCSFQIPEQYSFSSSHPDIGNFVKHDSSSPNPRAVALSKQLPIADSSSGIFCAFNAGTTTVSLTAGPLTYSLPVTVQAGSVRFPCGTVPLTNPPAATKAASSGVPPLPPPHPVKIKPGGTKTTKPPKLHKTKHKPKSKPTRTAPPPASSPPPAQVPTAAPRQPTPAAVIPPPILAAHFPVKPPPVPKADNSVVPVRGAVPPPPPPAARPVPPSGTSQVPSQSNVAENVPMAEKERQEIAAVQKVSNEAVVYDHDSSLPIPGWSIALIVLAAAAGGAGLRSRRRDDDETPWAWAGRAPRTPGARARTWHRPPPAIQRSSRPR